MPSPKWSARSYSELASVLGRTWQYPKELYKGQVWRAVWSCEQHATFAIEGWVDEKKPGMEYRPYTAEPITENADSAEAVVPNLAPAKPAPGTMHASANKIENAIKLFELQRGFPAAQVWMRDRMGKLGRAASRNVANSGARHRRGLHSLCTIAAWPRSTS